MAVTNEYTEGYDIISIERDGTKGFQLRATVAGYATDAEAGAAGRILLYALPPSKRELVRRNSGDRGRP